MYRHCKNCKYCRELKFIVRNGFDNAECILKHKYFYASRSRALFCLHFKERQDKSILNENNAIDSINKLTSNSAYYICDKDSKEGGYVIVDFIYNDIKKVHCYWTQDDDLFDDFIEFDDYDFYEFKIPRRR